MPMCQDVCWHSCSGSSAQDRDGFEDCRGPECADAPCGDFLLNECPVETHAYIRRMVQTSCSRGNPSPPPAPSPMPRPPPPPKAPPPLAGAHGSLRLKAAETAQSANCRPVTYAACLAASQEVGSHLRLSTNIEISLAACEAGVSTGPCFIGCTLGASSGAPALYVYLTEEQIREFGDYNSYRCEAAAHEYCLCAADLPPPPPPPFQEDESIMQYSGIDVPSTYEGSSSAFYKKVGTDIAMPESFRGNTIHYNCPAEDTGAGACARHCSAELGDDLVAFSVTGHIAPPPPPHTPSPGALPRLSHRRRRCHRGDEQFNGATDACSARGRVPGRPSAATEAWARSTRPTATTGLKTPYCGPRTVRTRHRDADIGDDSCEHANDGVCNDGGPGSVFFTNAAGDTVSLCGFATDLTDCPQRTLATLGPLSFSAAGRPDAPPASARAA